MATRYSTAAVTALGGIGKDHALLNSDISFDAATKTIASASNGFSSKSKPGDSVVIIGSALNSGTFTIVSAAPTGGSIIVSENIVDESAGDVVAIFCMSKGGSFVEVFKGAVGAFYTGLQPTSADDAETGTLLGYLTKDGLTFIPGSTDNSLNWGDSVAGVCQKPAGESWICNPIANGNVGYLRIYDNKMLTGVNADSIRVDLACGIGTGEVRFTSLTFAIGVPVPCNGLTCTLSKNPLS